LLLYIGTALGIVVVRCLEWLMPYVGHLTHGLLTEDERKDALEDATIALIEAIPSYNPALSGRGSAGFKTYAKKVVHNSLINYLKRLQQEKVHQKSEEELRGTLDLRANELDRAGADAVFTDRGLTDPLRIAQVHEYCQLV